MHMNLRHAVSVGFFLLALAPIAAIGQHLPAFPPPESITSADTRRDVALSIVSIAYAAQSSDNLPLAIEAFRAAVRYESDPYLLVTAAWCEDVSGNADAAIALAREAATVQPDYADAWRMLASLYEKRGAQDSLLLALRNAWALDSTDSEVGGHLAAQLDSVDPAESARIRAALLRRDPDAETAWRLARTHLDKGELDEAENAFRQLLGISGESDHYLLGMAELEDRRGNTDESLRLLRLLLERHEDEGPYMLQLADALLRAGRAAEARPLLLRASASDDIGHEDHMQIGKLLFQQALADAEAVSVALEVFDNLIARYQEDWRPVWFAAAVNYNNRQLERSAQQFARVLELAPNNRDAAIVLARAQLTLNRPAEALETLLRIDEVTTPTAESLLLRGHAYSMLDRDEDAVDVLEEARAMQPGNLDILGTLAMAYDALERPEQSIALYEEVLRTYAAPDAQLDENYFLMLNNFAYILARQGQQLERALACSRQALQHAPGNASYIDTMAWVLHRMGRSNEALPHARQAVSLRASAVLYEHLGEILLALGRSDEAREALRGGLTLDPDNARLLQLLEQLDTNDDH